MNSKFFVKPLLLTLIVINTNFVHAMDFVDDGNNISTTNSGVTIWSQDIPKNELTTYRQISHLLSKKKEKLRQEISLLSKPTPKLDNFLSLAQKARDAAHDEGNPAQEEYMNIIIQGMHDTMKDARDTQNFKNQLKEMSLDLDFLNAFLLGHRSIDQADLSRIKNLPNKWKL